MVETGRQYVRKARRRQSNVAAREKPERMVYDAIVAYGLLKQEVFHGNRIGIFES